jgi:hypothetical protein
MMESLVCNSYQISNVWYGIETTVWNRDDGIHLVPACTRATPAQPAALAPGTAASGSSLKRTHSIVREHILAALAPGTAASGSSLFRVESLGFRV